MYSRYSRYVLGMFVHVNCTWFDIIKPSLFLFHIPALHVCVSELTQTCRADTQTYRGDTQTCRVDTDMQS